MVPKIRGLLVFYGSVDDICSALQDICKPPVTPVLHKSDF